jgi:hypothetical protein
MAGITPAGWQNHIQNPLAAVMYAVMNGAFDNARDARRTDYQIGQDRQRQTDQDEELAARASAAGVDPTGLDRAGITAAMAKLMQQREQRSMADAAGERAANQAHRNQMADMAAKRERREASDSAFGRAATVSKIGDTWADNLGSVAKFFLGGGGGAGRTGSDRVQTVTDPNNGKTYERGPDGQWREISIAKPGAVPGADAGAPAAQTDETGDYLNRLLKNGALVDGRWSNSR